ncbi:hypothetical protein H257_14476 [Aphanomyces astaci]|uniref:Uncharacterized protein n=1 Tax=Aphanomyces astaci TaxID=112090 RepID=W4FQU9_APHAT|nr:hypothetical protein H257_14476 [Aphanomyces astaci]ETV69862.1 hypothetical protein H257_14476 [Aphanomyces astaci]|eukprot:XP_009840600.1 hypothetical protein H257_14476 [Aphanomyces astaci]
MRRRFPLPLSTLVKHMLLNVTWTTPEYINAPEDKAAYVSWVLTSEKGMYIIAVWNGWHDVVKRVRDEHNAKTSTLFSFRHLFKWLRLGTGTAHVVPERREVIQSEDIPSHARIDVEREPPCFTRMALYLATGTELRESSCRTSSQA